MAIRKIRTMGDRILNWKRTVCYHMDASIVPVLLEYIESAKHENRKFLYEAAKLDHFIEGERISN